MIFYINRLVGDETLLLAALDFFSMSILNALKKAFGAEVRPIRHLVQKQLQILQSHHSIKYN